MVTLVAANLEKQSCEAGIKYCEDKHSEKKLSKNSEVFQIAKQKS